MTDQGMPRTPPVSIRRQLRQEVGFGCPAEGCGNPYLEYHHFDPPWEIEHHQDPERMIALCATHHAKADAWTAKQMRAMKGRGISLAGVQGRFEWMREDVLAVVGGNFYYETPNMVVFREKPLIWFERDAERRLMLNMNMLSAENHPRTSLINNDWMIRGQPDDVESPPNGSRLRVKYSNGDDVSIRFRQWSDPEALGTLYPRTLDFGNELPFPLLTAEIALAVGGTNIRFGPTETKLGGVTIAGSIASHCGAGLSFN